MANNKRAGQMEPRVPKPLLPARRAGQWTHHQTRISAKTNAEAQAVLQKRSFTFVSWGQRRGGLLKGRGFCWSSRSVGEASGAAPESETVGGGLCGGRSVSGTPGRVFIARVRPAVVTLESNGVGLSGGLSGKVFRTDSSLGLGAVLGGELGDAACWNSSRVSGCAPTVWPDPRPGPSARTRRTWTEMLSWPPR